MIRLKPRPEALAFAVIACAFLAGCPVGPVLTVSPAAITFEALSVVEGLAIGNSGSGLLTWQARELEWVVPEGEEGQPPPPGRWERRDVGFLTLTSDDGVVVNDVLSGEVASGIDWLRVVVDRTGLPTEFISGFGVEIETNAGTRIIPLSLRVLAALDVEPVTINMQPSSDRETFVIRNAGSEVLDWEVFAITDELDPASVTDMPLFITISPPSGSVPPHGEVPVEVLVDRDLVLADPTSSQFLVDEATDTYRIFLLVQTGRGEAVVDLRFSLSDEGVFDVDPDAITIAVNIYGSGENPTETFTITNPSTVDFQWSLDFQDRDLPGVPFQLPGFIIIEPASGTLSAGRNQEIRVEVVRGSVPEATITDVDILVNAAEVGTATVTLRVIVVEGVRLSIRQEPRFRRTGILDFGTEHDLLILGVGNTGGVGTRLDFVLSTDRPELILLPEPSTGTSLGLVCSEVFLNDFFFCYDWVDFPIVINRVAMDPDADIDGGEIRIEATGVDDQEPIVVAVAIERAPLRIEGAMNRARPPYIQRFVFLLRDSLLESIDTTDPDIMRNISLEITEEDMPIELDETNSFITGPEGLTHNIVLLLDYTGSMLHAGEEDGIANGRVIEDMVKAASAFILSLPEAFRVSIMEYHEKNQVNRVIYPFSTDKEALVDALAGFELDAADHGETEAFDALVDALVALVAQDPMELPFDDTDVRSVVFVSDFQDTSSELAAGDVVGFSNEARVRLYPVAFGDSANFAAAIEMANETGGHAFQVIGPRKLSDYLGELRGISAIVNLDGIDIDPVTGAITAEGRTEDGQPAGGAVTSVVDGQIVTDLRRQLVLTYVTTLDRSATYEITATYLEPSGNLVSGTFQRDAVFFPGDVRAGQIALRTDGIQEDGEAVVYVRTDYVPRNITQLRFRFIIPAEFAGNLAGVELVESQRQGGILQGWHLIEEGAGTFTLVTDAANPLPFGAFGNLMRLTFLGLDPAESFDMGFRVDNRLYIQSAADRLVNTRFFLYPGGPTNPHATLTIGLRADLAGPAATVGDLQDTSFDPTAPFAYDRDEDGLADFDDPDPNEAPLPVVIPEFLHFSDGVSEGSFQIHNTTLEIMAWEIPVAADAFDFEVVLPVSSGVLGPDERVSLALSVVRTPGGVALPPGTYEGTLQVESDVLPEPAGLALTVEVQ